MSNPSSKSFSKNGKSQSSTSGSGEISRKEPSASSSGKQRGSNPKRSDHSTQKTTSPSSAIESIASFGTALMSFKTSLIPTSKPSDPPFQLGIEPDSRVVFRCAKLSEPSTVKLCITNTSATRQAYKMKCTSNNIFRATPATGFCEVGETVTLTLTFRFKSKELPKNGKHYFTAHHVHCDDNETSLRDVWKQNAKGDGVCRLMVYFEDTDPSRKDAAAPPTAPATWTSNLKTVRGDSPPLSSISPSPVSCLPISKPWSPSPRRSVYFPIHGPSPVLTPKATPSVANDRNHQFPVPGSAAHSTPISPPSRYLRPAPMPTFRSSFPPFPGSPPISLSGSQKARTLAGFPSAIAVRSSTTTTTTRTAIVSPTTATATSSGRSRTRGKVSLTTVTARLPEDVSEKGNGSTVSTDPNDAHGPKSSYFASEMRQTSLDLPESTILRSSGKKSGRRSSKKLFHS